MRWPSAHKHPPPPSPSFGGFRPVGGSLSGLSLSVRQVRVSGDRACVGGVWKAVERTRTMRIRQLFAPSLSFGRGS
eukprot:1335654-Pleurochrysis_carterae.AAC.1